MVEWKDVPFHELFKAPLRNGLNKPSRVRGSGLPMVNMNEIFKYDFIDDTTPMELVPVTENELSTLLVRNDLLFARQSLIESGAGKISIYQGDAEVVFESHLIRCRIDESLASALFLYYFFKSPVGRGLMSTIVYQTAAAGIRGSDLMNLEVPKPPLDEQRAIASVLSSLDAKIDLLHRQNKTLEAMAEALFRQWFVEEAENEAVEGTLADVAVNIRDGVPVNAFNAADRYVALEHIDRRCIALQQFGSSADVASNKYRFGVNDILFGKLRPYFHKVCLTSFAGICSTDILVIRPKRSELLYYCLFAFFQDEVVEYANAGSGGTRMPRTSWSDLSKYPIALPGKEKLQAFNKVVKPMMDKLQTNIPQIRSLTALRDTLLPKLMSGEVRVEGMVP